jgi:hypothetical protein
MMMRRLKWSVLCCAAALVCTNACWPDVPQSEGSCAVVPGSALDCRVAGYDEDELLDIGLVGYSCRGSARPDSDAHIIDGLPQGLLCADKGELEDSGEQGYCCTEEDVACAYDPKGDCREGESGYECWSNNRPESLNPALQCTNATEERGRTHYCCTGQPKPTACQESEAAGCSSRLLGFLCEGDEVPRGENLGANRSRADYFYPTCTIGRTAPNPEIKTFCCYMHLPIPQGGTCHPQPVVKGCEEGRFGFACYGPDHPEDNFPPMSCPDPGRAGVSVEGYEATLYCCDLNDDSND